MSGELGKKGDEIPGTGGTGEKEPASGDPGWSPDTAHVKKIRTVQAVVALCLWLITFAGGLLIETEPYRRHLAPSLFVESDAAKKVIADQTKSELHKPEAYIGTSLFAFCTALLWHIPSNLAILGMLSGFIGGCASNMSAMDQAEHNEQTPKTPTVRDQYMNESPWSAMIRSFIIYLTIIAGLYLVMEDPFDSPTPSKFIKLAGTISVLGVLVGYDPSRFSSFVGTIPNNLPSKLPPTNNGTGENSPDLQVNVKRTTIEEAQITKNEVDQADLAKIAAEAKVAAQADPPAQADEKKEQP